jgi:hypothetical protein
VSPETVPLPAEEKLSKLVLLDRFAMLFPCIHQRGWIASSERARPFSPGRVAKSILECYEQRVIGQPVGIRSSKVLEGLSVNARFSSSEVIERTGKQRMLVRDDGFEIHVVIGKIDLPIQFILFEQTLVEKYVRTCE